MNLSPASAIYLLVIGVFLPYVAIKSALRLNSGAVPMPERSKRIRASFITQAFMCGFALWTAHIDGIELFLSPHLNLTAIGLASLILVLALATLPRRWRVKSDAEKRRLYEIVPHGPREPWFWIGLCAAAGIGEEIAYRGVMFGILLWMTGSWWIASVVSAISFSVAHAIQGWRTGIVIFVLTMGLHWLVLVSGDLYMAMAVHFAYDLIATAMITRLGDRLGFDESPGSIAAPEASANVG